MIILVFGLPGSGKTTLCRELMTRTNAIHLNADEVRADLNADLGFTAEDRIEQARRMGALSRLLSKQGHVVLADFICPTAKTREVFGHSDINVFVDRIKVSESRFGDTNAMWEAPSLWNIHVHITPELTVEHAADLVLYKAHLDDWKKPTTLMLGRYQPWHEGHDALYQEAQNRTGQVMVAVRNTFGTSEKDPLAFPEVIKHLKSYRPHALAMRVPNITHIVYGRDVGYKIEKVELGAHIEAISATQKRKEIGL